MHKSSMLNSSFAVSSVVQSCFNPGSEVRVDSQFTGACPVLWTAGLGVQPAARNRTGSGAAGLVLWCRPGSGDDRAPVPTGLRCRAGSGARRALVPTGLWCRAGRWSPVPVKLVEMIREVDLLVEELKQSDVVFFKPGFSTSVTPLTVFKIDTAVQLLAFQ